MVGHPEMTKDLGMAVAGLSAAFITLGGAGLAATMASFAAGGAFAVGAAGLVATIGLLVATNWNTEAWNDAVKSFRRLPAMVTDAIQGLIAALMTIPNAIAGVANAIKNVMPSLPSLGGAGGGALLAPIDPGVLERSRRAEDLFRQDPEAARGRARHDHDVTAMLPIHIKVTNSLDGRVLTETISSQLAELSTFPPGGLCRSLPRVECARLQFADRVTHMASDILILGGFMGRPDNRCRCRLRGKAMWSSFRICMSTFADFPCTRPIPSSASRRRRRWPAL